MIKALTMPKPSFKLAIDRYWEKYPSGRSCYQDHWRGHDPVVVVLTVLSFGSGESGNTIPLRPIPPQTQHPSPIPRVHTSPSPSAAMAPALPGIYKAIFIYLEPILTLGGAYASYTSPEWFLTRLIPGDTNTGLIHTSETIMAIRLYAVLLFLLAGISISVFSAVGGKEDKLALSVTRRLLFILAGISNALLGRDLDADGSGGFGTCVCYGGEYWMGYGEGCWTME